MTQSRIFTPIALILIILTAPLEANSPTGSRLQGKVFVLDAGHGVVNFIGRVINPGRESPSGYRENKIALQIADRVGAFLQQEGATIYFTRTWKDYWRQADSTVGDNKTRILFANEIKANAFISIHCDWQPSRRVQGISTYFKKDDSLKLAGLIHRHLIKTMKASDRKLNRDSYTVLDLAEVPAVLIETGFLSNRTDSKNLVKPSYQYTLAKAISDGILEFYSN